jgi:FlaA1/EpsC-like NDP-sugar epimerase/lipopolysaccharide/colanic/teichoic acid biosynthesis glycosyltransferase
MKRLVDLVLSAAGLAVLWPVLLITALLIKLEGDGPVLFKQRRMGRRFRQFSILKFRTMVVDAPTQGPGVTIGEDRRITKIGRVLRKTKLDELPQLINVFVGDMSFVGPRPELPRYVELYRDDYKEVLEVRPGITDLASIVYRDESTLLGRSRDPEAYYAQVVLPDKIRMAKEYVRNASIFYDLRIIFATLMCLLYPQRAAENVFDWLGRFRLPIAIVIHGAAVVAANLAAGWIRFEGRPPQHEMATLLAGLPWLVGLRLVAFHALGAWRGLWRYTGLRDLERLAAALALSSVVFGLAVRWLPGAGGYSRGVVLIDALVCLVLLAGLRVARRVQSGLTNQVPRRKRAVLVAATDVAERVLRGIANDARSDYNVIGVLEPAAVAGRGATIHGVPVLGGADLLEAIVKREDPEEILVAGDAIEFVRDRIRHAALYERPVRAIPDPQQALQARSASTERIVQPEDLLFREPIRTDVETLRAFYSGRRVLVTGGGGSIGSEICRQVAALAPQVVVLFEKHEASLFHVERELRETSPGIAVVPVIGDITDAARVAEVFESTRPEVVFHAAAYKHVPMMELHPSEAFKTNVVGTRTVAEAAGRAGVEAFVLISTDKAVEPLSTMGLTKRIAELTVLGMNGGATRYMAVRFGNVLDSSGSVVPLFREQIAKGGPITVTHAEVTRLFMTVPEAVQLVLQCGTMGKGGEVFVLDMGKPVRIMDMARAMARMHGLRPGSDIEIVVTGLRPGERLFEKLFNDHEKVLKTAHPKVLMAVNGDTGADGREELRRLLGVLDERIRAGRIDTLVGFEDRTRAPRVAAGHDSGANGAGHRLDSPAIDGAHANGAAPNGAPARPSARV